MATAVEIQEAPGTRPLVEMHGVGWEGYRAILEVVGDRGVPRVIYLDGDVILMSPTYRHERVAERIGHLVMVITEELEIDCVMSAHTTFRRRKKRGGVEADKSFYMANADRVRGKKRIDLRIDPPPDLVVEAVYSHAADDAIEVYRRLGVPEVWVGDKQALRILALQSNGSYRAVVASIAFPFLTAIEIFEQLELHLDDADNRWLRRVRRWVREVLIPRRG